MNEVKKGGINWKVRLRNKQWVTAAVSGILIFVYQGMNTLGVDLPIEKDKIFDLVMQLLTVLVLLGIVQDPTTQGIGDSANAQEYEAPKEFEE